jgi:hypothetical protein
MTKPEGVGFTINQENHKKSEWAINYNPSEIETVENF